MMYFRDWLRGKELFWTLKNATALRTGLIFTLAENLQVVRSAIRNLLPSTSLRNSFGLKQ